MVTRTGANATWHEELVGGKSLRLAPVLTIELEEAWVDVRPILFIGSINDIVRSEGDKYELQIKLGPLTQAGMSLNGDFRLSVVANRAKIDSLLSSAPDITNKLSFFNNVAVVAQVESIQAKVEVESDGLR